MERVELHLHTEYSRDSTLSLPTLIRACQRRRLTTLFVTDHNETEGAFRLQKIAPFRVVVGEEITTSEGEIVGYFLKERIPPGLTPEATIGEIRRQGGLVSVPHPFDRLRHAAITRDALERIVPFVDIIEVFNSRNVFAADDRRAERFAGVYHKPGTAVSDAHSRWEVGRSTVEMPDFSSPHEFLDALSTVRLLAKRSPLWVHVQTKLVKVRKRLSPRTLR